jgi:hypothetical protein
MFIIVILNHIANALPSSRRRENPQTVLMKALCNFEIGAVRHSARASSLAWHKLELFLMNNGIGTHSL